MALYITSLNTGSNGNCFYIGNNEDAVLIDAGLSCKETEIRLARLGLSMGKVRAIFITHEHSDHVRGLSVLAKKYKLPVYITPKTQQNGRQSIPPYLVNTFYANIPISIGNLNITPFPKFHDAADPHSFIVSYQEINIGVFTDIGNECENLIHYFKKCNAAFLEANYDEEMLDTGRYPYFLKHRIRGGHGHLSNKKALELFVNHKPAFMSHLFLAHLSQHNNCPDLVGKLFREVSNGTEIIVASRLEETPVYEIVAQPQEISISTEF